MDSLQEIGITCLEVDAEGDTEIVIQPNSSFDNETYVYLNHDELVALHDHLANLIEESIERKGDNNG